MKYICPACEDGRHHRCTCPGVCECTVNPDTGVDEGA